MSKVPTINIEALATHAGFDVNNPETVRQLRLFAAYTLVEAANVLHEHGKGTHDRDDAIRGQHKAAGVYSAEAVIMRLANRMKG